MLLVIVVLFILAALFAPSFLLWNVQRLQSSFGVDSRGSLVLTIASITQWVMLVAAIGLTLWFLAKRLVAPGGSCGHTGHVRGVHGGMTELR